MHEYCKEHWSVYPSLAEVATDIMRIPSPSPPTRMPVGDSRRSVKA